MALNLKSAFLCTKAVWEEMAARKSGCIINMTSIARTQRKRTGGGGLCRRQRRAADLYQRTCQGTCPSRVRVNAVAPGVIATLERHSPPDLFQKLVASIPSGRRGTSEEVADVIVFLAPPAARYISGETIEVNGGMLMD